MDDSVLRGMAKWPNVPGVYGWLSLDRRGRWRLRGEPITHPGAIRFIARNYACDGQGNWYFQNGPQRVFVALEYTPWVVYAGPDSELMTHTGLAVREMQAVYLDEEGSLILGTGLGAALVCDRDLATMVPRFRSAEGQDVSDEELSAALQRGEEDLDAGLTFEWRSSLLPVFSITRDRVPQRLAFVASPQPSGDT